MNRLDGLSVLVAYRPDDGWRDKAWRMIEDAWRQERVELIVENPGPGKNPGEFNKPRAINAAAERATGGVFIIADADTHWTTDLPYKLYSAVTRAERPAPWAMPEDYVKLTRSQTVALMKGDAGDGHPLDFSKSEWVGHHASWSGLVCIPAYSFLSVGGYDERFEYWGEDDTSFGACVETLIGAHERVDGAAVHLWHPAPLGQTYGHDRHRVQHALAMRYLEARGDTAGMLRVRWQDEPA